MGYLEILVNILGHYVPGLIAQHYADKTEKQKFPHLSIRRKYHKIIGPFMAPAPDLDFGIQIVYSKFVEYLFRLPVDVGMNVPTETFREYDVPEEIIKYCDYFCHRTPTHGLLGVLLAAMLGYYLYNKVSDGNRKYAMFGATVYGIQVFINHLMFDVTQGPIKLIPFAPQIDIYGGYTPEQWMHNFLVILPILLAVGVHLGITLYYKSKRNELNN